MIGYGWGKILLYNKVSGGKVYYITYIPRGNVYYIDIAKHSEGRFAMRKVYCTTPATKCSFLNNR